MPTEVRKKVVSADCACAAGAARTANADTARPKQAHDMILVRAGIDSSNCFYADDALPDINTSQNTLFRRLDGEISGSSAVHEKRRRGSNRGALVSSSLRGPSGLLDRRQLPARAARPQEGPHFRGFARLLAALDQPAAGAVDGLVDHRE